MALGQVFIPNVVLPLFQELQQKLGGFSPILNVFGDERPVASAALHVPTLYPELNVPGGPDGDWGEVARGIAHLLSALEGIPELRVIGAPGDEQIAVDLNSELQILRSMQIGLQPKPVWTAGALDKVAEAILEPRADVLIQHARFAALKLLGLELDGHPDGPAIVSRVTASQSQLIADARAVLDKILAEDLATAGGKARAAVILLQWLDFDMSRFFLQQGRFVAGVFENRSLGYYPAFDAARAAFEAARPSPATWLKFQLPFALPVLEGVYRTSSLIALVQHVRVVDPRAGWRPGQGAQVDTLMNVSGLYARTALELWLPGNFDIDVSTPPSVVQHHNLAAFPEAVRRATIALNQMIAAFRVSTGRSDIPEATPGDITQLSSRRFAEDGSLIRDILSQNLEFVRLTTGAPRTADEIRTDILDVVPVTFARELLESAKFHVSAYNARRAVLDLAGAFEAFVAQHITPQLGEVAVNKRAQFLRIYGGRLSKDARREVEAAAVDASQDPPRMPSVMGQLGAYKSAGRKPALNQQNVKRVLRIMGPIRNDAAHGRALPADVLEVTVTAIDALDALLSAASEAKSLAR